MTDHMTDDELRAHRAKHTKENSWWLNDVRGIPCGRVCEECEETVKSHYRPEIFSGYDQSDVDEPIEDYDSDTRDSHLLDDDDFFEGDFSYADEFGDNYE